MSRCHCYDQGAAALAQRFHTFSNGTEREMWYDHNCRRGERGCRNYVEMAPTSRDGCPIEVALAFSCGIGDGSLCAKHALRGGFAVPGPNGTLVPAPLDDFPPDCPEYRGYDEPDDRPRRHPRPPADQLDLLDPRFEPSPTPAPVGASQ